MLFSKKFTIVTVSVKLIRIPGKRVIPLRIKTLLINTVEIKLIFFMAFLTID